MPPAIMNRKDKSIIGKREAPENTSTSKSDKNDKKRITRTQSYGAKKAFSKVRKGSSSVQLEGGSSKGGGKKGNSKNAFIDKIKDLL